MRHGYAALKHRRTWFAATEVSSGAKSWQGQRRVAARIEATPKVLNIRYVVINQAGGSADWLYETLYCTRGQMENCIMLHETQLASDRANCRSPLAEFKTRQMRLINSRARISETATRVRVGFAAACPEAALFRGLVGSFQPAGP
jgi:hypothetical protein